MSVLCAFYENQIIIPVSVIPLGYQKKDLNIIKSCSFNALIDTGATHTSISDNVVSKLEIKAQGKCSIKNFSGYSSCKCFEFHLGFVQSALIIIDDKIPAGGVKVFKAPVTGALFESNPKFDVIMGMDIISQGQLVVTSNGFASFSF